MKHADPQVLAIPPRRSIVVICVLFGLVLGSTPIGDGLMVLVSFTSMRHRPRRVGVSTGYSHPDGRIQPSGGLLSDF
jgi:hypothetical protein